ncbi:MAG: type II toxin-antitoxin system antitoxin SocA domain-containing protein [Steroidobacteraceae bacterium]
MLISRDREKLVNAIVYFADNTRYCGKTKLFKLLYLLDFHHFRDVGRSVTGLDYHAWKNGPVPFALVQEWDDFEPDLAAAVDVVPERVIDFDRQRLVPKIAFDDSHFTKRELRLMQDIAERHRDEMTKPLIGLTHEERGPRDKIWDGGRGNNERIPYVLAVPDDAPNREAILEAARNYQGFKSADRISPAAQSLLG